MLSNPTNLTDVLTVSITQTEDEGKSHFETDMETYWDIKALVVTSIINLQLR